jgi:hypothetical protein
MRGSGDLAAQFVKVEDEEDDDEELEAELDKLAPVS